MDLFNLMILLKTPRFLHLCQQKKNMQPLSMDNDTIEKKEGGEVMILMRRRRKDLRQPNIMLQQVANYWNSSIHLIKLMTMKNKGSLN